MMICMICVRLRVRPMALRGLWCTVPFVIGECHHAAATFDDRFVPFFMALRVALWPQNAQPKMSFVLLALLAAFGLSVLIVRRRMMPSKFVLLLIWRSKVCHINMSFASVARCVVCVTFLRLLVRVCTDGCVCVRVRQRGVVSRGLRSGELKA